MPRPDKILKQEHAASQTKYAAKKSKTHKRMCIWVPHGSEEDFRKAVERLQKKWAKA